MGKATRKRLPVREHTLARYAAIRLLAQLNEDSEVIAAIAREWNIRDALAKAIVQEAWDEITSADDGLDMAKKKGLLFMTARELFRQCTEQKDFAQANSSLRTIAKIWGLDRQLPEKRDKVEGGAAKPETKDEFNGRSSKDLRFYSEHGCFPEEYREPKRGGGKPDPLDGLH
jgi:hypothetical protein